MEETRFRPTGEDFQGKGVYRSDRGRCGWPFAAPARLFVSMSPSGYPSAELRPRSGTPDRWVWIITQGTAVVLRGELR